METPETCRKDPWSTLPELPGTNYGNSPTHVWTHLKHAVSSPLEKAEEIPRNTLQRPSESSYGLLQWYLGRETENLFKESKKFTFFEPSWKALRAPSELRRSGDGGGGKLIYCTNTLSRLSVIALVSNNLHSAQCFFNLLNLKKWEESLPPNHFRLFHRRSLFHQQAVRWQFR